jgi:polyisoprenoid-binding protein YceI
MTPLALAALLVLQSEPVQRVVPPAQVRSGQLSFDGRATLGDFTGVTASVTGRMTGGPLWSVTGWVEAPVESLKTGNGKRDRDLNKSMESDRFPALRFDLDSVTVVADLPDSARVILEGRFTIHGVTRPTRLPARVYSHGDGMRVESDFPLNLKDYRIGGLSKILGILKMHPDIVVHVDLFFAPVAGGDSVPPAGVPFERPPGPG